MCHSEYLREQRIDTWKIEKGISKKTGNDLLFFTQMEEDRCRYHIIQGS